MLVSVCLGGDTNINEAMDGALQPPAPWEDAWVSLRPDEPGYTFDVERNVIIAVFLKKARGSGAGWPPKR